MSKPSIRDVAREAGVGVGTVSRVLNHDLRVSEATRNRVAEVIRQLGYTPDLAARALRSRRTNTLGVLLPLFTRHFYVEVLREIEEAIAPTPYSLTIFSLERASDRPQRIEHCTSHGHVDGMLVISLTLTDREVARFRSADMPIVLLDSAYPGVSGVELDHLNSAYQAVAHLASLGHKRVALVDRPQDAFSPDRISDRWHGYLKACHDYGLDPIPEYRLMGEYSRASGKSSAERLLSLPQPPTAIFTGSDLQALGVLEAARERGLTVPDDLSVMGYHDIQLAEYVGLTTVRLPTVDLGRMAVEMLTTLIAERGSDPVTRRVIGTLVTRSTTGPPPSLQKHASAP